jgi:hypothetical protein
MDTGGGPSSPNERPTENRTTTSTASAKQRPAFTISRPLSLAAVRPARNGADASGVLEAPPLACGHLPASDSVKPVTQPRIFAFWAWNSASVRMPWDLSSASSLS